MAAIEAIYYNWDFRSLVDFSQPWDSPTNKRFLDGFPPYCFKCPGAGEAEAGITHYVAVVGPGTVWSGTEPRKLPEPLSADDLEESSGPILVVEWPESDIHWAEPRDVTVDEFLGWFRSKSRRSIFSHGGCLLYVDTGGQVHELPRSSDPEAVRKLLMVDD